MGDAAITKKPSVGVSKMSKPKREGWKFTASWDIPSTARQSSRGDRWEWVDVFWDVYVYKSVKKVKKDKNGKPVTELVYDKNGKPVIDPKTKKQKRQNVTETVTEAVKVSSTKRGGNRAADNPKSSSFSINNKQYYPYSVTEKVALKDKNGKPVIDPKTRKQKYETKIRKGYKLAKIVCTVYPTNSKGKGPSHSTTYAFSVPAVPKITSSFNSETNAIRFNIHNDDVGNGDTQQRYQTYYTVYLRESAGLRKGDPYKSKKKYKSGKYASSGSSKPDYPLTFDSATSQTIKYGQWQELTVEAYNEGIRGTSAVRSKTHLRAYPYKAEVKGLRLENVKTPTDPKNQITVLINAKHSAGTYVTDRVYLQRLRNSESVTKEAAAIEGGWQSVDGAEDRGNECKGFHDTVAEAASEPGKRTWYRVVSVHDQFTVFGEPYFAKAIYRDLPKYPTASDDRVNIIKIWNDNDDSSVRVRLGWKNDDSTGNELSWSKYIDAWSSTSQPTMFKFDDATYKSSSSMDLKYQNTMDVVIRELDPNIPVFIKARRYIDSHDQIPASTGPWADAPTEYRPIAPQKLAEELANTELRDVKLYIQEPIIRGRDSSASWTYNSEDPQTGWKLHMLTPINDPSGRQNFITEAFVDRSPFDTSGVWRIELPHKDIERLLELNIEGFIYGERYNESVPISAATINLQTGVIRIYLNRTELSDKPEVFNTCTLYANVVYTKRGVPSFQDTLLLGGSDGADSTVIPKSVFDNVSKVAFRLELTTGEKWVSNTNDNVGERTPISVLDPPKPIQLGSYLVKAQPLKIALFSKRGRDDILFTIRSQGNITQYPYGVLSQPENDVVYSDSMDLQWVPQENGLFKTIAEFPTDIPFIDGGTYVMEVTVLDPDTGLKSETLLAPLKVSWSHQATQPSATIQSNPNSKTVTIVPSAPPTAAADDVCDIYRLTPDGVYQIASNVKFGASVVDRYAPYSKIAPLSYRIALRTADGDVDWVDVPYNLTGYSIRFEWGGTKISEPKVLEVPYNLRYSDGFGKDFEERAHLNGDHSGYWNAGVSRSNRVDTDLVRLGDVEQQHLVRELAHYPGAVFARFPNGCAFMANVTVDTLNDNYDLLISEASFSITEVALTDEFRVADSDITNPI